MKVLVINNAMTPYVKAVYDRVVDMGISVTIVIPQSINLKVVGAGVKQIDSTVGKVKVVKTRQKKMWYGKLGLLDLKEIILSEAPDIVTFCWPYFLQLFFQPSLRMFLKKTNTKLMIAEIPFMVPPYGKIFSYYNENVFYNENMEVLSKGKIFYIKSIVTMFLRKKCYSWIDGTINYLDISKDLWSSYGVPKEKIHIVHNSTDTDILFSQKEKILKKSPLLPPRRYIIHIGRLVKWKRVDLLIDAFHLFSHKYQDVCLLIIGDGPEIDALKQMSINLGLNDKVIFIGAVYDSFQLGQYMAESSIYVLAGMGGLSINDAMAYGLPIICSRADGTELYLVKENYNGLFFKEGDKLDLANKIEQLLIDESIRKKMGENSLKIIKEKENINVVSRNYWNAFNQVYGKVAQIHK